MFNSITKSIVSRRQAADSAAARQGEGNIDTIALEMEFGCRRALERLERTVTYLSSSFKSCVIISALPACPCRKNSRILPC